MSDNLNDVPTYCAIAMPFRFKDVPEWKIRRGAIIASRKDGCTFRDRPRE